MKKTTLLPLIFILVFAVIFILMKSAGVPDKIQGVIEQISGMGIKGMPIYALVYAAAFMLMLPTAPLAVFAGKAYGVLPGAVICWLGAIAGAAASFLLARIFLRGTVEALAEKRTMLKAADDNIKNNAAIYLIIARIIPFFPASSVSYLFGMTAIRPAVYILWTALLLFPLILFYTMGSGSSAEFMLNGYVLSAMVVAAVILLVITAKKYTGYIKKTGGGGKAGKN